MALTLNKFAHPWFMQRAKKHELKRSIAANKAHFLQLMLFLSAQLCSTTRPFAQ